MKKNRQRAFGRLFSQPWAMMHPRSWAALKRSVMDGLDSAVPLDEDAMVPETEEESGVLVIPIRGTIVHHWTDGFMEFGLVTPSEWLVEALDRAEADESVTGVVLDIDSGGGMAAGTPEAAERIFRFREAKPIVAVANSFAASAAYYLGAAASEFYVTPSGEVGSIGTLMIHEDISEMLENAGVKIEILRATEAENKARFNPFEPLSDEEREHATMQLDTINARFLADVARFRSLEDVASVSGNGRTFLAEAAVGAGLVDGVRTLREVIEAMDATAAEPGEPDPAERSGKLGELTVRVSADLSEFTAAMEQAEARVQALAEATAPTTRSLPEGVETRNIEGAEVRAVDGESAKLEGVGLRYNSLSVDLNGFREEFAADAFADSLQNDDIRVIWQHDPKCVFGRVKVGTARVWSDDALRYSADPPDAQWARDAMASIRRGDIDQNSFAFAVVEPRSQNEEWKRRDGVLVRTVKKARLIELGPQTNPAYQDTTVAVRGMEAFLAEERKVNLGKARLALAKSRMRAA